MDVLNRFLIGAVVGAALTAVVGALAVSFGTPPILGVIAVPFVALASGVAASIAGAQ